jgi:cyclopropane fatty-acyl-phospholipid synthase-like methyltransferase
MSDSLFSLPLVSDVAMWDIWLSSFQLAAVTVADEIGLFNQLKIKPLEIKELASKLAISTRATETLSNVIIGLGFLKKSDDEFSLTPAAETYLVSDQPFYWGFQLENLRKRSEHKRILDVIKSTDSLLAFDGKSFTHMWEDGDITPAAAENFTHCMQATIFAPAVAAVKAGLFDRTQHLLDMGGGSGCFSVAYVNEYPDRQTTVFELPVVCDVTKKYLEKFSVTEKVVLYPGNFFKDAWPRGCDGILFSQIFHDWSRDYCKQLIELAYQALEPDGHVFIHEMLLDEDKTKPLTTACFDLLMYINHRSQQFTKNELFDLLNSVGFKNLNETKTFGYFSIISAKKSAKKSQRF